MKKTWSRSVVLPAVAAFVLSLILPVAMLCAEEESVGATREHADKAMKELDGYDSEHPGESKAEPSAPHRHRKAPEPPAEPPQVTPEPPAEPPQAEPEPPTPPKTETRRPAMKKAVTWDFESGDLRGWTRSGTAFDFQPTYGDNPTGRQRGQPAQNQGDYWIGTYEKRHFASDPAGQVQGDGPTGRLTSKPFTIRRPEISFLVGGGCDASVERVGLLIDGKVVRQATGKCTETMERTSWDVSEFIGKAAQIELVDESSGGWGHINFDDLSFAGKAAGDPD